MSKGPRTGVATWIGSFAAAVSAATAVLSAYRIRVGPVHDVVWPILCLLEAVVIGVLATLLIRRRSSGPPRGARVRNRHILESLFRLISADFENQLGELGRSQLSLYGRQVRNAQVHLLESLVRYRVTPLAVCATDIVRNLELWQARGVYRAANARFIRDGGRISRIFLVRSSLISNDADALAFWDMMEDHRKMGVDVAMHLIDVLSPEYVEDYVVYTRECVLVEIEQGDVDFSVGKNIVFFNPETIDTYSRRFRYLEASNDTKSAAEIWAIYQKYFVDRLPAGVPFQDRMASFLRDAL